jgi:antagonist of KipI
VPLGGAADRAALALGNALVGNSPDAPALELTLAGPTLRAEHRTAGVVFGAPFIMALSGGRPAAAGTTFVLEPGDGLKIGGTPAGARAYLCVAGGFDAPEVLGSRSGLGPLTAGDVLACREDGGGKPRRSLPFVALPRDAGTLRVLPGPQRDWFLHPERFLDSPYEVAAASNRMGVRLRGETLERRPGELTSEAIAPGAVQVTNDGQPVVLGVDGQTIGGYPKIAHVIRADLDLLGQLRPGAIVRFREVSFDEAEAAAAERDAVLREWLLRLNVTAAAV